MQPNHLIALVGVLLIASSVTGLVVVKEKLPGESNQWDFKTYHASFPTAKGSVTDSGSTADGGTGSSTLTIEDVNLTGGTLRISWTDNQPRFRPSASVSVDVQGPQDQAGSGQGSSGSISIDLGPFSTAPNETDIEALTIEDATKDAFENNPATTTGTGDWTITLTVTRSGFAGPFRQGSVDWTMTIEYENYSLLVALPEGEQVGGETAIHASDASVAGVSA